MLSHHLQSALSDLRELISITQNDINDIKVASHNAQFDRVEYKEEKLKSFEQKKAMIDHEISRLMRENSDKEISALLDATQHKLLDELKTELSNLRDVNKDYAKMVLSVSAFYNSVLERIVPTEMQGYTSVAKKSSSLLQVRV